MKSVQTKTQSLTTKYRKTAGEKKYRRGKRLINKNGIGKYDATSNYL